MEKIEVGEIFTIIDENDDEQEVEVLASMELDENQYVAVSFVDDIKEDSEEDIDVFFMAVDEDGDFSAIETDDEFEKVSEAFDDLLKEA